MEQKKFIPNIPGLIFLDFWGINPMVPVTFYTRLKLFINSLVILLCVVEVILQPILKWHSVYDTLGGAVEVIASLIQCVTKGTILLIHRNKFLKLFETVSTFWDPSEIDSKIDKEVKGYHDNVRISIRAYIGSIALAIIAYYAKPLFNPERIFPLQFYTFCDISNDFCYISNFICQFVAVFTVTTVLIGFDGLFVTCMAYAYCEIKIVKYLFENLKVNEEMEEEDESTVREFSRIALHHDKVLKFISDINDLYSLQLLIQFTSLTSMICFGCFLITASGFPPDMDRVYKCGSYILVYVMQLCIYCVGGTVIIHQTLSVGDAAYNSNWWVKPQKNVRKGIIMALMRSQKSEKITIGDFADLDLRSFMFVLKTTYSFVALMQTAYAPPEPSLT